MWHDDGSRLLDGDWDQGGLRSSLRGMRSVQCRGARTMSFDTFANDQPAAFSRGHEGDTSRGSRRGGGLVIFFTCVVCPPDRPLPDGARAGGRCLYAGRRVFPFQRAGDRALALCTVRLRDETSGLRRRPGRRRRVFARRCTMLSRLFRSVRDWFAGDARLVRKAVGCEQPGRLLPGGTGARAARCPPAHRVPREVRP